LFQDPLDVFAAERADSIRLSRSGINSLIETLLLFLRQQRRLASIALSRKPSKPAALNG